MGSLIRHIQVHSHCNDLGGKVWNPAIRWTNKHGVFVTIETDTGLVGTGESWCFDTRPDALIAFLKTEVIPHFIGAELDQVPAISRALTEKATLTARHGILASALASIDIAALDLLAQRSGTPLWRQLATESAGKARLYASGGLYAEDKAIDGLVTEMTSFANNGFRLSKMKVGALTLEQDSARVNAVLNALPVDTKLIIDGVYSYAADDALRLFSALPAERIEAFQSPTRASDFKGMTRLESQGVPVMATEAEYRQEIHQILIHDVGVSFLQVAPIAVGGITRVLELADLVALSPTRLSLEVSSTAVALMAAIQTAAARQEIAHVEFHSIHTVFFDALELTPIDGDRNWVAPPDKPGLGITLPLGSLSQSSDVTSISKPKNAATGGTN